MRENANIKIVGKNVILIPYEAKHVEKWVLYAGHHLIFFVNTIYFWIN